MKYLAYGIILVGVLILKTIPPALADCQEGLVEKCFVDGANTNCVCLTQPSEVEENPVAAPDGQINEDGGGQDDL